MALDILALLVLLEYAGLALAGMRSYLFRDYAGTLDASSAAINQVFITFLAGMVAAFTGFFIHLSTENPGGSPVYYGASIAVFLAFSLVISNYFRNKENGGPMGLWGSWFFFPWFVLEVLQLTFMDLPERAVIFIFAFTGIFAVPLLSVLLNPLVLAVAGKEREKQDAEFVAKAKTLTQQPSLVAATVLAFAAWMLLRQIVLLLI